jgi:23S rRNA U2552 (ribose-2'-O)-methylase RlmE/FtsJ
MLSSDSQTPKRISISRQYSQRDNFSYEIKPLVIPQELNMILLEIDDTKIFDKLYDIIKKYLEGETLSNANMLSLVVVSMKYIETYKELSGSKKKAIVLYVIQKIAHDQYNEYIKNEDLSHEEVNDLQTIISFAEVFLPSMIDTIISLDNKELMIKFKKNIQSCFKPCC